MKDLPPSRTYDFHRIRLSAEFRIHDLLRDYITSKSREHNIVSVYNGGENQWPKKIRRLAIRNSWLRIQVTGGFLYSAKTYV